MEKSEDNRYISHLLSNNFSVEYVFDAFFVFFLVYRLYFVIAYLTK